MWNVENATQKKCMYEKQIKGVYNHMVWDPAHSGKRELVAVNQLYCGIVEVLSLP